MVSTQPYGMNREVHRKGKKVTPPTFELFKGGGALSPLNFVMTE